MRASHFYRDLNRSVQAQSDLLMEAIPKIQSTQSINQLSKLWKAEQARVEFVPVKYWNPFTTDLIDTPIWGIPDIQIGTNDGTSTDLRLWVAKYYVKRLMVSILCHLIVTL